MGYYSRMAKRTKRARSRYAVGKFPMRPGFVVDRLEGPCKIAVRGDDGEVIDFATRELAEAFLLTLVSQ